jgi:translation elongation factor P/translation initiation factor 5A
MQIQVSGVSGMVYRRGHQIVLMNTETDKKIAVKVVQYDSKQGWLAENGEGDWSWYRELRQDSDPTDLQYWTYVKKVGT